MLRPMVVLLCLAAVGARAQTHAIGGVVLDASGTKPSGGQIRIVDVFADTCHPQNTIFTSTGPGGTIHFEGPPSVYVLRFHLQNETEPIYVRVDTRGGPVTNLVVRAGVRTPYASNRPPVAARIHVSEPDANQIAIVRGDAGAVAPSSFVFVVTQQTGHQVVTEAAADGSFTTTAYAPRGHSLVVKQDEFGLVRQRARAAQCPDATAVGAAPGTIVAAAPASAATGVPFNVAGTRFPFPSYEFSGTIDRTSYAPGERVFVRGTLNVQAQAIETTTPLRTIVRLKLENVAAAGQIGARDRNQFTSNLMTPTGFPIEHGGGPSSPRNDDVEIPLMRTSAGRATGIIDVSLLLPAGLAPGYYRPFVEFRNSIAAVAGELLAPQTSDDRTSGQAMLPIIRVGNPSAPRVPIALLMDHYSNATLGLRAMEDRERFGVASRIATQADDFTVPRVDELTGDAIRYRLEPFLPSVAMGDRGETIEPPVIPFKFPSGALRVTITSPDGTTRTIGPAPIAQAWLAPLTDRDGQTFDGGGGHPTEPMQLTTLDPRFEVAFERDGVHRVRMELSIDDTSGVTWLGEGTFDLRVGKPLTLDTNMLPGTPLETGDALALGATLVPPMPADIEARVTLVPHSDRTRTKQWTRTGKANAFGYARLEPVTFDEPGEYRVDITAVHRGHTWSGTRTWGSVVAPRNSSIVAHGNRAIDDTPFGAARPQWFFRTDLQSTKGTSHVPFPFLSGDVTWQERGDSAVPALTFQDVGGKATQVLQGRPGWENLASGEALLRIFREDGEDAHLDPSRVDAWMYAYASVQRPLVRVREEIFDNPPSGGYWRFGEQYAAQPGVGRAGDSVNDFKFQFGGVVLRGALFGTPMYAIYGSLFVLVPDHGDPHGGTRTFPPFQGNPGGVSGGPLFRLKGQDVDLFVHPTGLRPGSVLTRGETLAFSGYVAPPIDAKVNILTTSPSGATRTIAGKANRIGWFYDPAQDFAVNESGVWRAKVTTTFEGVTSSGQVQAPFPTGDVPGSRGGEFYFYVMEPGAPLLDVRPSAGLLRLFDKLTLSVTPPHGLMNTELHYTATMPGFVLEEGSTASMSYTFDVQKLIADFPNLDVDSNGTVADVITITLAVSGTDSAGVRRHHARQISVVHGEVLLSGAQPAKRRAVR